jgi:hypothetical protein
MSYKVISEKGDKTIVETEGQAYQLDSGVWSELKAKIDEGLADASILSIVCNVKASSVKEYDAEKAARAVEREARNKALEAFESTLKDHVWSKSVTVMAENVAILRAEVSDLEDSPMVVNLGEYKEVTGLVKGAGEFSFRVVTRGGEKFPIIELSPGSDIPVVESRSNLETALAAFRVAAADEVGELTPETLKTTLRINNFDVDEDGNVVFDYKAKVRRGSGGGRRAKGHYVYEGETYNTLTELGQANGSKAKYPHKNGAALVEKGEAVFVPNQEEEA